MKSIYTLFVLFVLALAGCTGSSDEAPEPADATADATAEYDASDPAMLRPDALNPVNDNGEIPLGWKYRFDNADTEVSVGTNADSADVFFVTMTPGWHITATHASGIYWHPASTAEGEFTASTAIHLFPPGQRNEAFGLIFGGADLEKNDQSYLYFLIRRSGEYLVKKRMGNETETLAGWDANPAILAYTEDSEGTVLNKLSVSVTSSSVSFLVNDTEVYSMPKGDLATDGIVGLRLNHGLNVHVESLEVL